MKPGVCQDNSDLVYIVYNSTSLRGEVRNNLISSSPTVGMIGIRHE